MHASKYSKTFLTKLGAFTVCTLHAHNSNAEKMKLNRDKSQNNENEFKNASEIEFNTQQYYTPRGSITEQSENMPQQTFVRQSKFSATMKEKFSSNDNLKIKNDFIFDIEK